MGKTQLKLHTCHKSIRNTPTCMGKTNRDYTDSGNSWKHPHVHGEDVVIHFTKIVDEGNTPTCMGKTHGGTSHII